MYEGKVSIIIRTCGRPHILKNALNSVRAQTYKNIETVVIEDGINKSEEFIMENYSDLNISYVATMDKVGRSRVGNIGLNIAKGDFLNFLDDDDILLPNHVEILIKELKKNEYLAVYSIAEEHQIKKKNQVEFIVKRKLIRYKQPYNKLLLYYLNYIPIQSIMFSKKLYEKYGGFDESLTYLEDWDVWVRYSLEYDFLFVPEVTSVYYTPYKSKSKSFREVEMQKAAVEVMDKHRKYGVLLNVDRINKDVDYLVNIYNKKGIIFYMQKIRNYFLYQDR